MIKYPFEELGFLIKKIIIKNYFNENNINIKKIRVFGKFIFKAMSLQKSLNMKFDRAKDSEPLCMYSYALLASTRQDWRDSYSMKP